MADEPGSPESNQDEVEGASGGEGGNVREQDRFLPIANISRIMKKALPANAKIAKDAKETVQECVSEFISFITSEASDKCQREKRKTINGDDLLWAMSTLGFEDYVEPLKVYLHRYREGEKATMAKQGTEGGSNNGTPKDKAGTSGGVAGNAQVSPAGYGTGTPVQGMGYGMQPQMMVPGNYQVPQQMGHPGHPGHQM